MWTEDRRAGLEPDAFELDSADVAGLARSAVDLMDLGGASRLAEGVAVVAQGRAARHDRGAEDPADGSRERIESTLAFSIP